MPNHTLAEAVDAARNGKSTSLRCPGHDDKAPSLSVRPAGPDGWVRLKCFRGCDRVEVLAAGGLSLSDLGPERPQRLRSVRTTTPIRSRRTIVPARVDDDAERAAKRSTWPTFEAPTPEDLATIANVRGISLEGLRLAVDRKILWTLPDFRGHRAWVVTDSARLAAQARRIDGLPWPIREGSTVKALSLPGSRACWPVGLAAVAPEHEAILLLEGAPDLLSGHVHLHAEDRETDAVAVAMLGASAAIAEDALAHFTGRRVRIVAHADAAGNEAARRWGRQLLPHAVVVDVVNFGTLRRADGAPTKDLADTLHVDADVFENARILRSLVP